MKARHTTVTFLQPLLASKYNEAAQHIPQNIAPSITGLECQTHAGMCGSRAGVLLRASVVTFQFGCERIILQDKKYIIGQLMIREGVMQKYNYMSEHDACMFRTSS